MRIVNIIVVLFPLFLLGCATVSNHYQDQRFVADPIPIVVPKIKNPVEVCLHLRPNRYRYDACIKHQKKLNQHQIEAANKANVTNSKILKHNNDAKKQALEQEGELNKIIESQPRIYPRYGHGRRLYRGGYGGRYYRYNRGGYGFRGHINIFYNEHDLDSIVNPKSVVFKNQFHWHQVNKIEMTVDDQEIINYSGVVFLNTTKS